MNYPPKFRYPNDLSRLLSKYKLLLILHTYTEISTNIYQRHIDINAHPHQVTHIYISNIYTNYIQGLHLQTKIPKHDNTDRPPKPNPHFPGSPNKPIPKPEQPPLSLHNFSKTPNPRTRSPPTSPLPRPTIHRSGWDSNLLRTYLVAAVYQEHGL